MNDSFGKHCPLPNWRTEGRRKGRELGVKTKMEYLKKIHLIQGEHSPQKQKQIQQQTFSDTRTPIKQPNKQKNQMANKQFNQTIQSDIRPLQSDIKFLFLIPFNPTGLDQVHIP